MHSQQTMKIWEEQHRWREAEARGDDLTLLAQQWKQEDLDGIAAGRLPNSTIVEMMDDECCKIVKRHIGNCSRVINPWLDEVRAVKSDVENPLQWAQLVTIECYAPRVEIERKRLLKSLLVAYTVKQAKISGKKTEGYESITEQDVESARAVAIEGLYDYERGTRIAGRFRSCCPFHSEKTGSFFIFKDNKFRCFGCGEHGDAIDFVMKTSGIEFLEAVKYLIKK